MSRRVRARVCDGRDRARNRDRSSRISSAQLCRPGRTPEQAVVDEEPSRMLRARSKEIWMVETKSKASFDARTGWITNRLRYGDGNLSGRAAKGRCDRHLE